jgi:hypothetical protein
MQLESNIILTFTLIFVCTLHALQVYLDMGFRMLASVNAHFLFPTNFDSS